MRGRVYIHESPDIIIELEKLGAGPHGSLVARFGSLDISHKFVDPVEEDPAFDERYKAIFNRVTRG